MPEVLVVDDDPDIRMLVAFALEDAGMTVRHAKDGEDALAAIEAKVPDAVVLDVMMPGTDGMTVLQRVRARRSLDAMGILMLTARIGERDHLRGWVGGADEYMTKPFDPAVLAAKVKALLATNRDEVLARRQAEADKAALLERLELAFRRSSGDHAPAAPSAAAAVFSR